MIHCPHLPLEALEGGPIHPRWMFLFERFMKKLQGYVRNKAKPEGSIAEGYVAEEALTLSSLLFFGMYHENLMYRRNVDPSPKVSVSAFTGRSVKSRKQFQRPEVASTSELFALANGPSRTLMSVNACVVDGVRYVMQSRDERRTTQNSGICAPGPDGEMSYGQLQEILEFKYLSFKVAFVQTKTMILAMMRPLPHDLADSDMADVARAHGGDGGGEDPSRPPPTSFGCAGCFINRGKGKRKAPLGGREASRKSREKHRNQVLKDAVAANIGWPIRDQVRRRADNTVVPTVPTRRCGENYFEGLRITSISRIEYRAMTRIEGYIQA
ncbi:reverse transcriptase domain-containing protein [Tanacetum coccineum]